MKNKSTKFFAILLGILFISFVGAAAYTLLYQDTQPITPMAPKKIAPQTKTDKSHTFENQHHLPPSTNALGEKPTDQPPHRMPENPATMAEKPEPRQVPRKLTEEQMEENRQEIARMAEALPDNMWVPKDPTIGFSPDRGEKLRKSIELSDKIRKQSATPKEQQEYYSFKLKETTDKIELIRYIARRTEELSGQSGREYLTKSDVATGEERIEELEQLADEFQQKLSDIKPESP